MGSHLIPAAIVGAWVMSMGVPAALAGEKYSGGTIGETESLRLEIKGRTVRPQTFPMAFALHLSAYCPYVFLPFQSYFITLQADLAAWGCEGGL